MKRSILVIGMIAVMIGTAAGQARGGRPNIFAPDPVAAGPIADVVKTVVTAFNNRDAAYFQKAIAPDAVWLDEDGHHLQATVWITRLLSANPPRKLSITDAYELSQNSNGGVYASGDAHTALASAT